MADYILTKEVRDNLQDFYKSPDDLPPQVGWQKNQIIAVRDQYAFISCAKKFIVVARRSNEGDLAKPVNVWTCTLPNNMTLKGLSIYKLINEICRHYLIQELINDSIVEAGKLVFKTDGEEKMRI